MRKYLIARTAIFCVNYNSATFKSVTFLEITFREGRIIRTVNSISPTYNFDRIIVSDINFYSIHSFLFFINS